jgi:2-hydroxy-6-oxonona-2,4-dienedioate hydrolase
MCSTASTRLLVGDFGLLGAAAYMRHRMLAFERRMQIARGEVRKLREVWTTVGGCRWSARAFTCQGARESVPVVLVHGFGISSAYYVPTAERLAPSLDVYVPDLPGHGKSATPARQLDVTGFAEALHQWMVVMHIDCACIVGHSMGSQIAVE